MIRAAEAGIGREPEATRIAEERIGHEPGADARDRVAGERRRGGRRATDRVIDER